MDIGLVVYLTLWYLGNYYYNSALFAFALECDDSFASAHECIHSFAIAY